MKIAMYFSGRISTYEDCIGTILQLKQMYNITFFCSLNLPILTEYEHTFFKVLDMTEKQYYFENVVSPAWVYTLDQRGHCVVPDRLYSQFYNNKKCIELINEYEKTNEFNFDIIIKYRADIQTYSLLPLSIGVEKNTVYVPNGFDYNGGLNDQIAYGDRNTMIIYSTLVDRIPQYCIFDQCAFHPESLNRINMNSHTIMIHRFEFPYCLHAKRGSLFPV